MLHHLGVGDAEGIGQHNEDRSADIFPFIAGNVRPEIFERFEYGFHNGSIRLSLILIFSATPKIRTEAAGVVTFSVSGKVSNAAGKRECFQIGDRSFKLLAYEGNNFSEKEVGAKFSARQEYCPQNRRRAAGRPGDPGDRDRPRCGGAHGISPANRRSLLRHRNRFPPGGRIAAALLRLPQFHPGRSGFFGVGPGRGAAGAPANPWPGGGKHSLQHHLPDPVQIVRPRRRPGNRGADGAKRSGGAVDCPPGRQGIRAVSRQRAVVCGDQTAFPGSGCPVLSPPQGGFRSDQIRLQKRGAGAIPGFPTVQNRAAALFPAPPQNAAQIIIHVVPGGVRYYIGF